MGVNLIGNTGVRDSSIAFKKPVRIFLARTVADDGTVNEIDMTATNFKFDQTKLNARLNEIDPTKRWYDIGKIEDVLISKGDNVTDTAGDGTEYFVQEGIYSSLLLLRKQDIVMLANFDIAECGSSADYSVYMVDDCKNILVEEVVQNKGRAILLANGTFNALYRFATDTSVNQIELKWNIDKSVDFSRLNTISGEDTVTADILNPQSLFNVNGVDLGSISVTGFTVTMEFDYGGLGKDKREKLKALVAADFVLTEITPTPGDVTITTVTETPAASGIYVFVIPAATSSDLLELTSSQEMLDKKFELKPVSILIP